MSRYIDADAVKNIIRSGVSTDTEADQEYVCERIDEAPSIEIIRCGECKYWIDDRKAEEDMGTCGLTHYFTNADDFCSYGMRNADSNTLNTLDALDDNSSEKPNNCEDITEDGVTCAKYPACDDCLDNPLNKLKGSERLVKGSEQTDCQTCKWWSSCGYCVHRECKGYAPQTEREGE